MCDSNPHVIDNEFAITSMIQVVVSMDPTSGVRHRVNATVIQIRLEVFLHLIDLQNIRRRTEMVDDIYSPIGTTSDIVQKPGHYSIIALSGIFKVDEGSVVFGRAHHTAP
jgi:hypothetical protein